MTVGTIETMDSVISSSEILSLKKLASPLLKVLRRAEIEGVEHLPEV
jgi:hypothetical protein